MRILAIVCVLLAPSLDARSAHASDFWDEVKTPGLKAYRTHLSAAENALRSRHFPQALEWSQQAISIIADRSKPHLIAGMALGELGQFAEAAQSFERCLTLDPEAFDLPASGARVAVLMMKGGRYKLANKVLARLVARLPPSSHRRELYATYADTQMLLDRENLKQAIQSYRTALRSGVNTRATIGLALALDRAGKHEEAMSFSQRITRSQFSSTVVSSNLPASESAARLAIGLEAQGSTQANIRWEQASVGVWASHAKAAATRTEKMPKKKKTKKKKKRTRRVSR